MMKGADLNHAFMNNLAVRLGRKQFGHRLNVQSRHYARRSSLALDQATGQVKNYKHQVIRKFLKLTGLLPLVEQHCLDYRVETVEVVIDNLPSKFDGFRILHLSDLHLDFMQDGGESMLNTLKGLEYDLCVFTGDYRVNTSDNPQTLAHGLQQLMPLIDAPYGVYGVLGNHDNCEMVSELEQWGIHVLLNESVAIERDGQSMTLAGVDDPHYFKTDNLKKALHGTRREQTTLLLAHSPEIVEQAAAEQVDYYLCGHTHGGQLCLPGGIPVISNVRCSRKYIRGYWRHQQLQGYTSRGTGTSGVQARLFCPPEVTIHTLKTHSDI